MPELYKLISILTGQQIPVQSYRGYCDSLHEYRIRKHVKRHVRNMGQPGETVRSVVMTA